MVLNDVVESVGHVYSMESVVVWIFGVVAFVNQLAELSYAGCRDIKLLHDSVVIEHLECEVSYHLFSSHFMVLEYIKSPLKNIIKNFFQIVMHPIWEVHKSFYFLVLELFIFLSFVVPLPLIQVVIQVSVKPELGIVG